jgi:thiol-disulfide isomerase/thioredoxin
MPTTKQITNAIIITIIITVTANSAETDHNISLYFFYGRNCGICDDLKPVIREAQERHPELDVKMLEVQYNLENNQLLDKMANAYGKKIEFVPAIFISDQVIEGYFPGYTEKRLDDIIVDCMENGCVDPLDMISGKGTETTTTVEIISTTITERTTTTIKEKTTTSIGKTPSNESSPILCPIDEPCGEEETTTTVRQSAGEKPSETNTKTYLASTLALITLVFVAYRVFS